MSARFQWAKANEADARDLLILRTDGDEQTLLDAVADLDAAERNRATTTGGRASVIIAAIDEAGGRCTLAHMGDARAYLYRAPPVRTQLPLPLAPRFSPEVVTEDGGGLVCLTWDHSTACDLVEMEILSRAAGRQRARRRVLTRSLGAQPATTPDLIYCVLEPGDRLLLCSAGLWLAVDDGDIAEVLAGEADSRAACRALVDRARDAGASHPPSALLISWQGGDRAGDRMDGEVSTLVPTASAQAALPATLTRYGRDLTGAAAGDRAPMAGRKRELRALVRCLMRMQKPNALLVGEPGVGKTWLVEALARTVASPACPPALRGCRLIELSMGQLVAGTRYRGDLEERITELLTVAEAAAAGEEPVILFIDEIHMIAGGGTGGDGAMDAANLLKPALARGAVRVIGATTPAELDRHLVGDDALMRRFEIIRVDEPSRADALAILSAVAPNLEDHHGVTITAEAREAAVDLGVRYLPDRRLPDKAIDLLDQACTRAVSRWLSMSLGSLAGAPGGLDPLAGSGQPVGRADVAAVIADRVQLPLELVELDDAERMRKLPRLLADRVLGQPAAVTAAARVLQRGYRGLGEPGRPIASMLLTGPTGVGKTSLARAVAELLFDSDTALLRIDMSEYMERHAVSRLLGAAPGYVGHGDGDGFLIAAMRERPARVVLFDEIEKAHPDVLNLLLQILDAGWLRGSRGQSVSFRDAVVVLTSNLTAEAPQRTPVGFGARAEASDGGDDDALRRALESSLSPELLGRLGAVIRFAALDQATLAQIADRHLLRLVERLIASGAMAGPSSALRDRVLARVTGSSYGARTVERTVEDEVSAWLDEQLAATEAPAPGAVVLDRLRARPRASVALLAIAGDDPGALIASLRSGPGAGDLLYLKHAGVGALAVFGGMPAATRAAEAAGGRSVLHWGRVDRVGDDLRGPDIDSVLARLRER